MTRCYPMYAGLPRMRVGAPGIHRAVRVADSAESPRRSARAWPGAMSEKGDHAAPVAGRIDPRARAQGVSCRITMVQSVELVLDPAAEAEIRRQWRVLSAAGIHSPAPDHRPHITVAVAREIWPRLDRVLAAQPFRPMPVRLGGLLIFGARRPILVRLVVPTEELLAVQRRIAAVVDGCPGIPATMRPSAWTPHVTLARRLSTERLAQAIAAVGADRDRAATVVGIRRWDGDRRIEWPIADDG